MARKQTLRHSASLGRIDEEEQLLQQQQQQEPLLLLRDSQLESLPSNAIRSLYDNDDAIGLDIASSETDHEPIQESQENDDNDSYEAALGRQKDCFHQWIGTLTLSLLMGVMMSLLFCAASWSSLYPIPVDPPSGTNGNQTNSTHHDENIHNSTSVNNYNRMNDTMSVPSLQQTVSSIHSPTTIPQQQQQPQQYTTPSPPQNCEATIMLLRHCEKVGPSVLDNKGNSHCSVMGWRRNQYLASLFGTRWPLPTQLYAKSIDRDTHQNYRQVETLELVANKTGLSIDSQYNDERPLANHILQTFYEDQAGPPCGEIIAIAWKHSGMNALAQALGWQDAPDNYPKYVFDQVWQLQYVFTDTTMATTTTTIEAVTTTTTTMTEVSTTVNDSNQTDYEDAVMNDDDDDAILVDDDSIDSFNRTHHHKHKKKKKKGKKEISWVVYGTVTQQNFDPLQYSYHQP